jgi:ADP-ribosylglycohydrolase
MKINMLFFLLFCFSFQLLNAAEINGNPNSDKHHEPKAKGGITKQDLPTVALVVWDEKAKEGSDFAEFQIYQEGEAIPGLVVYYSVGGTTINGYDYTPIADSVIVEKKKSIRIQAIDDLLTEGDETVEITLKPHSTYRIDPNHRSKKIVIQDNEFPDVQFLQPSSAGDESVTSVNPALVLSETAKKAVRVDYTVSAFFAENNKDYILPSGSVVIPAGSKSIPLPLTVLNNTRPEDDKTIIIELLKAEGANIGINDRHFYTILNDDGEVSMSTIYDKIYGIILGSRAGSSMGAITEMVVDMDRITQIYGVLDQFIPYIHYNVPWTRPSGATEDGIERQKLISTAIIEKQDRITDKDLMNTWIRDCDLEDMQFMTQPFDKILYKYARWGVPPDELPNTRYGMPFDLGGNIHLTARVFHPLSCVNAGDPEGVIEDMNEIGNLYYENKKDDAFGWGGLYNAALALAVLPGATINSVIEDALKYATPEIRKEIEYGLAIADKYRGNPMDPGFRKELNQMYAHPSSPYFAANRIEKYVQSSIYENVTCAFAIFKATNGNVRDAVIVATNRGRDTDCTAASAAALAGALTGSATIPPTWIETLENGTKENPYTNSHMTNRATAQGLYRALETKLSRLAADLKAKKRVNGGELPNDQEKIREYLDLMLKSGVKF